MVESAIAAAFVHSAVDDGDGNGNSGRWSLAAGNGNVRFRWQDDDNNISMGGEMRKYLLASFILLYPSLKSGRSPGSRQEVARKSWLNILLPGLLDRPHPQSAGTTKLQRRVRKRPPKKP